MIARSSSRPLRTRLRRFASSGARRVENGLWASWRISRLDLRGGRAVEGGRGPGSEKIAATRRTSDAARCQAHTTTTERWESAFGQGDDDVEMGGSDSLGSGGGGGEPRARAGAASEPTGGGGQDLTRGSAAEARETRGS